MMQPLLRAVDVKSVARHVSLVLSDRLSSVRLLIPTRVKPARTDRPVRQIRDLVKRSRLPAKP